MDGRQILTTLIIIAAIVGTAIGIPLSIYINRKNRERAQQELRMRKRINTIDGILSGQTENTGAPSQTEAFKKAYGDGSGERVIKHARIISMRNSFVYGINCNRVLFQYDDGSRIELGIRDDGVFGLMAEGDSGDLISQGNTFIDFIRS